MLDQSIKLISDYLVRRDSTLTKATVEQGFESYRQRELARLNGMSEEDRHEECTRSGNAGLVTSLKAQFSSETVEGIKKHLATNPTLSEGSCI